MTSTHMYVVLIRSFVVDGMDRKSEKELVELR